MRLEIFYLDVTAHSAGDFTSDYVIYAAGRLRNCGNDTAFNVTVSCRPSHFFWVNTCELGDIAPGEEEGFGFVGTVDILDLWDSRISVEAESLGGASDWASASPHH